MPAQVDIRKTALPLIIIAALLVITIPVCQMVDCSMPAGQMHHMATMPGMASMGTCDTMQLESNALSAVIPPSAQSLMLTLAVLVASFAGWSVSLRSSRLVARKVIRSGASPPDPLGVRLIV